LEIDVQGALEVMESNEFAPITVFIHPGTMEELEDRLRARNTESEAAIDARLETASVEMRYMHRYQYEVINGSVDVAVAEICQILKDQTENHPCSKN
jgi:guanylate kinase